MARNLSPRSLRHDLDPKPLLPGDDHWKRSGIAFGTWPLYLGEMHPIEIASGQGKSLSLLGIPCEIRLHGRETGGALSIIEMRDLPGGGAPQHLHRREDETFQILEGQYEFTCGGRTFVVGPGSTVFAPRDIPHGYRYLGQTPGRILLIITPAGIEDWFEEVGALQPAQQDIPRVIEMGKKYGLEFLPPPAE